MKRSNSASNIPMPWARMRSGINKGSIKDGTGSSSTQRRTGSMDRLALPTLRRSSSSSSISKRSTLTPTVGNKGFMRSSNLATPSSRSRSRSPYRMNSAKKVEWPVNDKKWVSEQFSKVRWFLSENPLFSENFSNQLKPPTTNTFVQVMGTFLHEIDPGILLTTANYKEIVFDIVKKLHYPGNISMSLLKTVNTMHSWPHVVAMWAWFVDLILVLRRVDMEPASELQDDVRYQKVMCVTDFIIARYHRYNSDQDQTLADEEFSQKFANLLNIDEEELNNLNEQITIMQEHAAKQETDIIHLKNKTEQLTKRTDEYLYEIETFHAEKKQKEEEIDEQLKEAALQKEKLREMIRQKKESVAKLKKTVKKQPCTMTKKKEILERIEGMKHTNELRRESMAVATNMKAQFESKRTELKKIIETEVFRLNNTVMKLVVIEPKYKILYLEESEIMRPDLEDTIKMFAKNLQELETGVKEDILLKKHTLADQRNEISELNRQKEEMEIICKKLEESEDQVKLQLQKWLDSRDELMLQREEEKKAFAESMKELERSEPNLEEARKTLEELKKEREQKEKQLNVRMEQSVDFFLKLREMTLNKLADMIAIRDEIFNKFADILKRIEGTQMEVIEDLHKLDEVKKPN